ncbi:MAG: hypothetical protein JEZ08_03365 [Clostridiales bacterium]|nr:hypothetical protein [Clostridiales bacterium]
MYSKDFFEKYAILSLVRFYDSNLKVMLTDEKSYEKPDFQSRDLGVGIEVTEAITSKYGEQLLLSTESKGSSSMNILVKDLMEQ